MSAFERTAKEVEKAITDNGGKSVNAKVNPERQREIHADYLDADGLAHHLVLLCGPQHDHYANIEADVQRLVASRQFQAVGPHQAKTSVTQVAFEPRVRSGATPANAKVGQSAGTRTTLKKSIAAGTETPAAVINSPHRTSR